MAHNYRRQTLPDGRVRVDFEGVVAPVFEGLLGISIVPIRDGIAEIGISLSEWPGGRAEANRQAGRFVRVTRIVGEAQNGEITDAWTQVVEPATVGGTFMD